MSTSNERYYKMSFLTKLYSIKCKRGAFDACMSNVIDLLANAFYNVEAQIPPSFYEAKKQVTKMGLNYIKIDACEQDCMLYWGDDAALEKMQMVQLGLIRGARTGQVGEETT